MKKIYADMLMCGLVWVSPLKIDHYSTVKYYRCRVMETKNGFKKNEIITLPAIALVYKDGLTKAGHQLVKAADLSHIQE